MPSGVPESTSITTIRPWIVGSPCCRGLSGKFALIFAAKTSAAAAFT